MAIYSQPAGSFQGYIALLWLPVQTWLVGNANSGLLFESELQVNFWNTKWALQSTYTPFGQEGHNPIHKICPFITHLNQQFQKVYVPDKNVCIDEALCPFKGRSWFRAYMKDKPTKWGLKFYKLCESSTGYVFHFEMFCVNRHPINKPCCCLAADATSAGQRLPLVHGQLLLLPQTVPWSCCHRNKGLWDGEKKTDRHAMRAVRREPGHRQSTTAAWVQW